MPRIPASKSVEALRHQDASRRNIPTAEYQSMLQREQESPVRVAYERRNRDLDPQLVWRGKDKQDWSDLVVTAPPLYIQEKIHPKVLIDDLLHQSRRHPRHPANTACRKSGAVLASSQGSLTDSQNRPRISTGQY